MMPKQEATVFAIIRKFKTVSELKEFYNWLIPLHRDYTYKININDSTALYCEFLLDHDRESTFIMGFRDEKTFLLVKLAYADMIIRHATLEQIGELEPIGGSQ